MGFTGVNISRTCFPGEKIDGYMTVKLKQEDIKSATIICSIYNVTKQTMDSIKQLMDKEWFVTYCLRMSVNHFNYSVLLILHLCLTNFTL